MRTRLKLAVLVAIAGVLLILLATAAGAVFCQATLHVQRETSPSIGSALMKHPSAQLTTVHVAGRDGADLEAWFVQPATRSGKCVMVLHGIGDSRQGSIGFAPMFLDAGYSVITPDSRSHGRSGGDILTYGLLEKNDVIGWARWLIAAGCTSIYGLGESLGGATLIQASALSPVFQAIVAECAYSDLQSIAEYRVQGMLHASGWPGAMIARVVVADGMLYARVRYGLDFRDVSPRASIARTNTPILLIHGTDDSRTPSSHSVALAAANPNAKLWLVPGAEHTSASVTDVVGFRTRVLGWLDRGCCFKKESASRLVRETSDPYKAMARSRS